MLGPRRIREGERGSWEKRAKDNEENAEADERITVRKKVLFLEAKRGK